MRWAEQVLVQPMHRRTHGTGPLVDWCRGSPASSRQRQRGDLKSASSAQKKQDTRALLFPALSFCLSGCPLCLCLLVPCVVSVSTVLCLLSFFLCFHQRPPTPITEQLWKYPLPLPLSLSLPPPKYLFRMGRMMGMLGWYAVRSSYVSFGRGAVLVFLLASCCRFSEYGSSSFQW